MHQSILDTPLTYLSGVGPRRASLLDQELELRTFMDLLHYFPYKYIDRSRIYTIREIRSEMPYIQLRGYIRQWRTEGVGRKQRLIATFQDKTGVIDLLWFKGLSYIERSYQLGQEYLIFGKPTYFNGTYSISHPEIDDAGRPDALTQGLIPVYSITERLKSAGMHPKQFRQIIHNLLVSVHGHLEETLPPDLYSHSGLMSYAEAIAQIHFPSDTTLLEQARRRLKVEELLYIQLKLQSLKLDRQNTYRGYTLSSVGTLFNRLYHDGLPFDLTGAQKRVLREIRADVLTGRQMNRLVQGDVGSGKTLVAVFAMLLALDNGYQACLMAPTEILARQHYAGISELLTPLGVEVGMLIGSTTKREREKLLSRLSSGELSVLIGTHALIEQTVQFARLGMAVIDEQHRFGVEQRARLWTKTSDILPHILIMSATPIPRTLAMTLYGDLDISIIDELPPGRQPIRTLHQTDAEMYRVYNFLRQQVGLGRQAYVVFPMIEDSDREDLKALETGLTRYQEVFPDLRLVMVHGKMKSKEKDAHMQRFVSGEADILLATTVIEVGVNVPNASVMVIEGANRFGLSQLHQLRGRVGRGAEQSYCILVTGSQLGADAQRRIQIMCETNDGFVIAEEDMRLRGFGELEGKRQSGQQLSLRIANPARDSDLVLYSRNLAERILSLDPTLSLPEHVPLRRRLAQVFAFSNWGSIS